MHTETLGQAIGLPKKKTEPLVVSFTAALDYLCASSSAKRSRVAKEAAQRIKEPYSRLADGYRQLREAIETAGGKRIEELDLSNAPEAMRPHLRAGLNGWNAFVGAKGKLVSKGTKRDWYGDGITVRINPELTITHKHTSSLTKLYFKAEPLESPQMRLAHTMLRIAMTDDSLADHVAILDVRKSRLRKPDNRSRHEDLVKQVEVEMRGFSDLIEYYLDQG